jgi:glycosyltransferase involved in cell wall biosynthesis
MPKALFAPLFSLARKIYSSSIGMFVVTKRLATTISCRGIHTLKVYAPNGADTALFFPRLDTEARKILRLKYSLPIDKIVMVYAGSGLTSYSRLDFPLLAMSALHAKNEKKAFLTLYVTGGADHLRKQIGDLKMPSDLVEVHEALPRERLAEILSACDVGLVPLDDLQFLHYATSTKLYEYLSAGLYVVGSGPKNGELDATLSERPYLGSFIRPTVWDFVHSFLHLNGSEEILSDYQRSRRHLFIREHYDRQKTMELAWKNLLGFTQPQQ